LNGSTVSAPALEHPASTRTAATEAFIGNFLLTSHFAPEETCTGDCKDISISPFLFYMSQKHQYQVTVYMCPSAASASCTNVFDSSVASQFAFLGLYCLVGVPLFGWSVSAIGAVFAAKISGRDAAITLHQAFTPEEFELMRLLGKGARGEGHEDKAITLFKFVECQVPEALRC